VLRVAVSKLVIELRVALELTSLYPATQLKNS
jgi:hypothetical protein